MLNLQTHYGFSTKLSEYLVSGIPVLVTSVSDNALYIKDGYNGFVVQPGDYEKMSKIILSIVKQYQDIKDSIGKNAFVTAQQYFHYAVHSKKLHRFLFAAAQQ